MHNVAATIFEHPNLFTDFSNPEPNPNGAVDTEQLVGVVAGVGEQVIRNWDIVFNGEDAPVFLRNEAGQEVALNVVDLATLGGGLVANGVRRLNTFLRTGDDVAAGFRVLDNGVIELNSNAFRVIDDVPLLDNPNIAAPTPTSGAGVLIGAREGAENSSTLNNLPSSANDDVFDVPNTNVVELPNQNVEEINWGQIRIK